MRIVSPLAFALALTGFTASLSAGVTSKVTVETYKDWNEGEAGSSFITSLGEVKPGWATEKQDLSFEGTR